MISIARTVNEAALVRRQTATHVPIIYHLSSAHITITVLSLCCYTYCELWYHPAALEPHRAPEARAKQLKRALAHVEAQLEPGLTILPGRERGKTVIRV